MDASARVIVRRALVVVCIAAACRWVTEPPRNAERFDPPAVYVRWWAMTEACSGRSGDLADVRWYRVPGREFMVDGRPAGGVYNTFAHRIALAEDNLDDGAMVRHEMLHALLRRGGHPQSLFFGACASVVSCNGGCGAWHPPRRDYVILPPDSLEVDSDAQLLPREADGQRWLALWITVRNARARAVVVAAPGDPVNPTTWGFDLRGPRGGLIWGEVAMDSSVLFFQPGETKRWLFEFRVADELTQYHVYPGTFLMKGGYARHMTPFDTVAVSP